MDCCGPLCCTTLAGDEADVMAARLKALSDPTRLRLFNLIANADEACACDLTEPLGVSQPTVSHHLKALTEAGLWASRLLRSPRAILRATKRTLCA